MCIAGVQYRMLWALVRQAKTLVPLMPVKIGLITNFPAQKAPVSILTQTVFIISIDWNRLKMRKRRTHTHTPAHTNANKYSAECLKKHFRLYWSIIFHPSLISVHEVNESTCCHTQQREREKKKRSISCERKIPKIQLVVLVFFSRSKINCIRLEKYGNG